MPETRDCREQVLSEDYRDFIVSRLRQKEFETIIQEGTCRQEIGYFYDSVSIYKDIADPVTLAAYPYNSIPKCFTLLDTQAMTQAGILQVQNYPTLNLLGSGVLIGFIDTGIDYQNPVFRNLDGSTRIVGIWDQTVQTGTPPEGIYYGTEYTKTVIDEALQRERPLELVASVDETGHGTFLASIAAGGVNVEQQFIGAAPEAAIAMVKLKPAKQYLKDYYEIHTDAPCYQENDIMLGVKYLDQLASSLNLPLVICIAVGTNMGGHSALSPLVGLLEVYSNLENRVVVIAAGNEADKRHHFLGVAENVNDQKTVEIQVSNGVQGFCMELWTENPNLVSFAMVSPSGEQTPDISIRRNRTEDYRFVLEGTRVVISYRVFLERSNSEMIFFQVQNPTEGIWKIIVKPIQVAEGTFHIWLPITEFLEQPVYFLESNPNTTFTEPGSTLSGMTVGFYNGDDNSVAISSGRGYTRGNVVKPNFVAPGVNVTGATTRNQFVNRSGSSIAAGITAGAAALLLEWILYEIGEATVDSIQIRNLLTLGTERNPEEVYPNRIWGYGKLNLYRTFDEIRRI